MKFTKPINDQEFLIRTDFYSTPEIMELSEKHGSNGSILPIYLYCDIYGNNGKPTELSEEKIKFYCEELELEENELLKTLNTIKKLKLFKFNVPDCEEITNESLPLTVEIGL